MTRTDAPEARRAPPTSPSGAAFAVLIPHYNQPAELDAAIESCARARMAERAHIVLVDDCSADRKAVAGVADRWRESGCFAKFTFLVSTKNQGVAKTLNSGLLAVEEPYFFRIDSDDRCYENRFELQLAELEAGADLVFSEADIVWQGDVIATTRSPSVANIVRLIHVHNFLLHPSLAARRAFFEQYGDYPPESKTEDWDFWKSTFAAADIRFVRRPLIRLGLHLDSVSNAKFARGENTERLLPWKTALRYNDRRAAKRAAQSLGGFFVLVTAIGPNPYRLRIWAKFFLSAFRTRRR